MPFDVCDIAGWVVVSQEARGLDPKDWVVHPDHAADASHEQWWLFKPVKEANYRRYDDWSERLAAALAKLIGLPAANVELAKGVSESGIISQNVTPDGWSMDSGDTLLSEFEGYVSCAGERRPANRVGHNLDNILTLLQDAGGPPGSSCEGWSAAEVFAGYLVFDAWIANTDRHAINWSVLTCDADARRALAASFDHGTALASGAQEAHLAGVDVKAFAGRGCASRFEDGARVALVDFARDVVDRVGGRATQWIDRLRALQAPALDEVLDELEEMSEARRRFLGSLLLTNQRRLTQ